jgi:hypothetical protein
VGSLKGWWIANQVAGNAEYKDAGHIDPMRQPQRQGKNIHPPHGMQVHRGGFGSHG